MVDFDRQYVRPASMTMASAAQLLLAVVGAATIAAAANGRGWIGAEGQSAQRFKTARTLPPEARAAFRAVPAASHPAVLRKLFAPKPAVRSAPWCAPGDACWPTPPQWSAFNSSVGGALIAVRPILGPCWQYGPTDPRCTAVIANYSDPWYRASLPGALQDPYWESDVSIEGGTGGWASACFFAEMCSNTRPVESCTAPPHIPPPSTIKTSLCSFHLLSSLLRR